MEEPKIKSMFTGVNVTVVLLGGNMIYQTKIINLFGGPGCGKSTTRAKLFSMMKEFGDVVEETTEYAKDLTWDVNNAVLADQLYVLAKQNRKLERLKGKVEWVITDSPLLLSINYARADYLPQNFKALVFELFGKYSNRNYLLTRHKKYSTVGRNQTLVEATQIDNDIKSMLMVNQIEVLTVRGDTDAAQVIFNHIRRQTNSR